MTGRDSWVWVEIEEMNAHYTGCFAVKNPYAHTSEAIERLHLRLELRQIQVLI